MLAFVSEIKIEILFVFLKKGFRLHCWQLSAKGFLCM